MNFINSKTQANQKKNRFDKENDGQVMFLSVFQKFNQIFVLWHSFFPVEKFDTLPAYMRCVCNRILWEKDGSFQVVSMFFFNIDFEIRKNPFFSFICNKILIFPIWNGEKNIPVMCVCVQWQLWWPKSIFLSFLFWMTIFLLFENIFVCIEKIPKEILKIKKKFSADVSWNSDDKWQKMISFSIETNKREIFQKCLMCERDLFIWKWQTWIFQN